MSKLMKIGAVGGGSLVLASASMLGMINQWEGRKYPVYLDIGGVPTVCEGHTGPEVKLGDVWTKERCDAILTTNASEYARGILKCIQVPINQNQFDAYTLFAINVGVKGFCTSRASRELNKGRYRESCRALAYDEKGEPVWSFVKGKYVQGLHNRRKFESELCLKPIAPTPTQATSPTSPTSTTSPRSQTTDTSISPRSESSPEWLSGSTLASASRATSLSQLLSSSSSWVHSLAYRRGEFPG